MKIKIYYALLSALIIATFTGCDMEERERERVSTLNKFISQFAGQKVTGIVYSSSRESAVTIAFEDGSILIVAGQFMNISKSDIGNTKSTR